MGHGVVAVAVSGGRDSTALLHATARWARDQGDVQVLALHVHHGLMPEADAWWRHLARQCARWRTAGLPVRFMGTRLRRQPAPGDSIEAWARRERYRALGALARAEGASLVLLAHHRQDQAETFLLQALRGAGPRGLAAMPKAVSRDGLWWCRPWLDSSGAAIDAYVRRYRLKVVHDASNEDRRLARSRLRHDVWPALLRAFPEAEVSLADAARRAQESLAVVMEVAQEDLARCCDAEGRLSQRAWMSLSTARRAWLLRVWLRERAGRGVPERLVERLVAEWPQAGAGHRWSAPGGWVHSVRDGLYWQTLAADAGDGQATVRSHRLDLSCPGRISAPGWGGHIRVQATDGPGVDASRMRDAELRERKGSDRFQFHPRSLPRSLKKQFQAAGVSVPQREGPLVVVGDQLVYVPGLGLDARALAPVASLRLTLRWVPDRDDHPTG